MDNNVYLIAVGDVAVVVDGGSAEPEFVREQVGGRGLRAILQTHNHGDHTAALREIVDQTGAEVFAHPDDALPVDAQAVGDGSVVHGPGELEIAVIHTPGHTPGSVCFILRGDDQTHVFAGDTLFPGGPGNTFGDKKAFARIMQSLDERLFTLPDDAHIYPGHGADTTIGAERGSVEEWRARGW